MALNCHKGSSKVQTKFLLRARASRQEEVDCSIWVARCLLPSFSRNHCSVFSAAVVTLRWWVVEWVGWGTLLALSELFNRESLLSACPSTSFFYYFYFNLFLFTFPIRDVLLYVRHIVTHDRMSRNTIGEDAEGLLCLQQSARSRPCWLQTGLVGQAFYSLCPRLLSFSYFLPHTGPT